MPLYSIPFGDVLRTIWRYVFVQVPIPQKIYSTFSSPSHGAFWHPLTLCNRIFFPRVSGLSNAYLAADLLKGAHDAGLDVMAKQPFSMCSANYLLLYFPIKTYNQTEAVFRFLRNFLQDPVGNVYTLRSRPRLGQQGCKPNMPSA